MASVLIVDDDQSIRETLRFVLEDTGYEVEEARDGVEALQILRSSMRPMVALLDLMMPRMNGVDVLCRVANDAELRRCHAFIIVTANPRAPMLTVGRPGAHMTVPCIEKPFDLDDLLGAVAQATLQLMPQLMSPQLAHEVVACETAG